MAEPFAKAPSPWPAGVAIALTPLAWLYAAVMRARRWAYRRGALASHRLPGRTISIGNVEVGGTGKSPVIIALARHLLAQGAHPVILARGYRSGLAADESAALRGDQVIMPPQRARRFAADEARMQAEALGSVPVVIGADRWGAAQRFRAACPDLPVTHWLLDDGFQHRRIARDVDVVLMRADAPWADGRVIPAGRLREGRSALADATAILVTKGAASLVGDDWRRACGVPGTAVIGAAPFRQAPLRRLCGPETPQRRNVAVALGIAHPAPVIAHLTAEGYRVAGQVVIPDHGHFPTAALQAAARGVDALVTTAKDWARDPDVFRSLGVPVYELPVEACVDEAFWRSSGVL